MKHDAIGHLLPGIFQRTIRPGSPLAAILELMEQMHAPSEEILRDVSVYFDPRRTPDRFVPYLVRWVDLDWLLEPFRDERRTAASPARQISTGVGRLRELVAIAAVLARRSGTAEGLLLFLRTATGAPGFRIDEQVNGPDGLVRPFHIRVRAPLAAAPHRVLIQRIIDFEKPAYVTYDLEFGDEHPT